MELDEKTVDRDPVAEFGKWLDAAGQSGVPEPNAMHLATVGKDLRPSARIMLLKGFGPEGFSFFTNYNSRKAEAIRNNPYACLTFFWPVCGQQIRIEGKLRELPASESDAYFRTRPRGSQIGAWSSPQSQFINGRQELDERLQLAMEKFGDSEVPRPAWWGGYLLVPDYFEFWQARESRLHDRICYRKDGTKWIIYRLAP